jgi:hypothetical protein
LIEGRIEALRADRHGSGISLSKQAAAALAGEWYDWFTAKHDDDGPERADDWRDEVHEAFVEATTDEDLDRRGADKVWAQDDEVRRAVRPVLADVGETAQFLRLVKSMVVSRAGKSYHSDQFHIPQNALVSQARRGRQTPRGASGKRP